MSKACAMTSWAVGFAGKLASLPVRKGVQQYVFSWKAGVLYFLHCIPAFVVFFMAFGPSCPVRLRNISYAVCAFCFKPLKSMGIGLVTAGSEVYSGCIRGGFGSVVTAKLAGWNGEMTRRILVFNNTEMIATASKYLMEEGVDIILVTGRMPMDPGDVTPAGVVDAGVA